MTIPFAAPQPQQGWLCPKCQTVNAPWLTQCATAGCRPSQTSVSTHLVSNTGTGGNPLASQPVITSMTQPSGFSVMHWAHTPLATGGQVTLWCGAPQPANWTVDGRQVSCAQCHNSAQQALREAEEKEKDAGQEG